MSNTVVLADAPVVDNHCHGFRPLDLLKLDPSSWEQRLTMMGMCYLTSTSDDERLESQLAALSSSTVFALTAKRWLSVFLGVDAGADLAAARHLAFASSPNDHVARLLSDQRVLALLVDDGYPQPPVSQRRVPGDRGSQGLPGGSNRTVDRAAASGVSNFRSRWKKPSRQDSTRPVGIHYAWPTSRSSRIGRVSTSPIHREPKRLRPMGIGVQRVGSRVAAPPRRFETT